PNLRSSISLSNLFQSISLDSLFPLYFSNSWVLSSKFVYEIFDNISLSLNLKSQRGFIEAWNLQARIESLEF
ncbi:hypothetical protein GIB67_039687, partial [Kingdonia uniflora]